MKAPSDFHLPTKTPSFFVAAVTSLPPGAGVCAWEIATGVANSMRISAVFINGAFLALVLIFRPAYYLLAAVEANACGCLSPVWFSAALFPSIRRHPLVCRLTGFANYFLGTSEQEG